MKKEIIITNKPTEEGLALRYRVFVTEQKFSYDYDNLDSDPAVTHVLIKCDGIPAAAGRLIPKGDGAFYIGRVSAAPEYRGCGLGAELLAALETEAVKQGGRTAEISAQLRVQGFYEKFGYIPQGVIYYEEYCKHIHMTKQLKETVVE